MKSLSRFLCLAGLALVTLISVERANAYTLTYNGAGMGQGVSISFGTNNYNGYAGQLNFTFTGGAGTPSGYPSSFTAYCVELENGLVSPMDVLLRSSSELTKNGITPNSGNQVAWLYNTFASSVNTNLKGAALQVAIWEVLYDSSYNLGSGYFKLNTVDAALTSQVNTYITALQSNYSATNATWFQAVNPATSQDMIGPGSTNAIPEPGMMSLLAGSGFSSLMLFRCRYSRKK
jgi:hypothetical protein